MKTNEQKKHILDSFIANIICLSDQKYQERIWLKSQGPECDDMDDAICDFFDDGEIILEKYKEFGINETQHKLLIKLRNKLRYFTDKFEIYSPKQSQEKKQRMNCLINY